MYAESEFILSDERPASVSAGRNSTTILVGQHGAVSGLYLDNVDALRIANEIINKIREISE